jgi:hypothetical protein
MLISLAALVAVSATVPAAARDGEGPAVTLVLPGGAVEQFQAFPPQVFLAPALDIDPAFAALDRMEAALDRQADLMLRLPALTPAMLAGLPEGASSITVVSTFSSNVACTRTTQVSTTAGQAAPRTVSSISGNCGPTPDLTTPARDLTPDGQRIVPAVWER